MYIEKWLQRLRLIKPKTIQLVFVANLF